MTHVKQRPAQL